jgi:hypothetical protein
MHRARWLFFWGLTWLAIMALGLGGCSRDNTATVVELSGQQPTPLPLRLASLTGVRAGYLVNATLQFTALSQQTSADASQLAVRVVLRVGIPTTFERGDYELVLQGERHAGPVTSPSLTFLGGQGGNPSIGGTFVLHDSDGAPAYRVTLPNTVMRRSG